MDNPVSQGWRSGAVSLRPLAGAAAGGAGAMELRGRHRAAVTCLMQHRWPQSPPGLPLHHVLVSGSRSSQTPKP